MGITSKKFSEIVVQILYSFEMQVLEENEIVFLLMSELKCTKKECSEALGLATKIWEGKEEIDHFISTISTGYDFKRIGPCEKSVLRLAIFEGKPFLDEALRLSKKFCADSAASFVHAMLDKIFENQGDASLPTC